MPSNSHTLLVFKTTNHFSKLQISFSHTNQGISNHRSINTVKLFSIDVPLMNVHLNWQRRIVKTADEQ